MPDNLLKSIDKFEYYSKKNIDINPKTLEKMDYYYHKLVYRLSMHIQEIVRNPDRIPNEKILYINAYINELSTLYDKIKKFRSPSVSPVPPELKSQKSYNDEPDEVRGGGMKIFKNKKIPLKYRVHSGKHRFDIEDSEEDGYDSDSDF